MLEVCHEIPLLLPVLCAKLLAAGAVHFLFEVLDLTVQGPHGVCSGYHSFDQALALYMGILDAAHEPGGQYFPAANLPAMTAMLLWIFPGIDACEFFFEHPRQCIVLTHFLDLAYGGFGAGAYDLVGDFLFVKNHYIFNRPNAALQIGSDGNDFLNHKRTA